ERSKRKNMNHQELFDRYYHGRLSQAERTSFEDQLAHDADMREEYQRFQEVVHQLGKNAEKKKMLTELDAIHREMLKEKTGRKQRKLGRTIRFHSVTMLVAATVALIIVSLAIFTINYVNSTKTQEDKYIRLKREVALIQRSQRAIIDTFKSKTAVEENVGKYTGTGFLLNKSGYVLTSYHL